MKICKVIGNKEELLSHVQRLTVSFNDKIKEMQDKNITAFGKRTNIKVSQVLPWAIMSFNESNDGFDIELVVPIPEFMLKKYKKELVKYIKQYFDEVGVKAEIKD
jgi:ribosome recycling factor